jgi:acetyltransferase-like isoleucine patch superfamily enzyme
MRIRIPLMQGIRLSLQETVRRNKYPSSQRLGGFGHRGRQRLIGPIVTGSLARLRVSPTAGLGNVLINTIGGHVDIGDYVFFGHDVLLLTGTHDFRLTGPKRQLNRPTMNRDIVIESGAWIASRAIVIGPCRIGRNAVIGSGCIVDFDVPADTLLRVRQEVTKEKIKYLGVEN